MSPAEHQLSVITILELLADIEEAHHPPLAESLRHLVERDFSTTEMQSGGRTYWWYRGETAEIKPGDDSGKVLDDLVERYREGHGMPRWIGSPPSATLSWGGQCDGNGNRSHQHAGNQGYGRNSWKRF